MRRPVAIAWLTAVAALTAGAAAPTAASGAPRLPAPPTPVRWWNAGDSYAAGEGTIGAAGTCQQSAAAFGPKAVTILASKRGWTIPNPVFSACTGAIAEDEQLSMAQQRFMQIKPACADKAGHRDPGDIPADDVSLQSWAATQPGWADGKFDVITLSSGGNDLCFSDMIIDCLGFGSLGSGADTFSEMIGIMPADNRCTVNRDELHARIDALFNGGIPALTLDKFHQSLPDLWNLMADRYLAADGVLVVVGYPRLFTPSTQWGAWRGGRCNTIVAADTDMLGEASEYLDQKMAAAVTAADAGRGRIRYVSRLQLFDANGNYHSLCAKGVEWLNTELLFLRDGTLRKERGFHPNDLGHTATGEAVAGAVADTLDTQVAARTPKPTAPTATAPAATAATSPPTVASGDQTYEVGSPFSDTCTVAWPTAPDIGTTSITMRTTCRHQPPQFLFTDITYGDPNLPVTPNHPTVKVTGHVADIVHSQFGFTVLVVVADTAQVQ